MSEHVFENLHDLARLPWFSVEHGRLVLSDRTVGPILDAHTHIALAYVRPMQLDLYKPSHAVQHYLPSCARIDFHVYQNKNIPPDDVRALQKDLTLGSLTAGGMRATHTVPNLVREMDELGVRHSVLLPIDFPWLSNNAANALEAARRSERILSFGSVHPIADRPGERLDEQAHHGARGVKVHPNVQLVRPDHEKSMRLFRLCGERNLPVLIHCGPVGIETAGGRARTQVRLYEKPIAENPRTTFLLGHAGALQMDEALDLQRRYPNVYMEMSGQSVDNVRTIVTGGDPNRVVYGSDWPFYHQALGIAKICIATQGNDALRHKVLWANAAKLFGLER